MRRYWTFYWPLALTGAVMLLGRQFENAVLAKYPDAVRELATFALASSVFWLSNAALIFVPQMTNALALDAVSRRRCLVFTLRVCLALSGLLIAISTTPAGAQFIRFVFDADERLLGRILTYVRLLAPFVFINGLRMFCSGLLIQAERTRLATVLNMVQLAVHVGTLAAGLTLGWSAMRTMVTAVWMAGLTHLALLIVPSLRSLCPDRKARELTYADLMAFFWPVATTSTFFALSRPVMFAFINRQPGAAVMIAALRVAFDCGMMFLNPCNQFRHLMITFGGDDPKEIKRFLTWVGGCLFAVFVVFAFTPASRLLLERVVGITGETLVQTIQALRMLTLTPIIITIRNYYHGKLMVARRTRGMAAGAALRVGWIALGSWLLMSFGLLNHVSAAAMLVGSFGIEALVSFAFVRAAGAGLAKGMHPLPPD